MFEANREQILDAQRSLDDRDTSLLSTIKGVGSRYKRLVFAVVPIAAACGGNVGEEQGNNVGAGGRADAGTDVIQEDADIPADRGVDRNEGQAGSGGAGGNGGDAGAEAGLDADVSDSGFDHYDAQPEADGAIEDAGPEAEVDAGPVILELAGYVGNKYEFVWYRGDEVLEHSLPPVNDTVEGGTAALEVEPGDDVILQVKPSPDGLGTYDTRFFMEGLGLECFGDGLNSYDTLTLEQFEGYREVQNLSGPLTDLNSKEKVWHYLHQEPSPYNRGTIYSCTVL